MKSAYIRTYGLFTHDNVLVGYFVGDLYNMPVNWDKLPGPCRLKVLMTHIGDITK